MKKTTQTAIALLFVLSFVAAACAPQARSADQPTSAENPLQVTVSILPQAYFVERIGGDLLAANVMVGPGDDAHTYEPKPEQMRALSESVLFFSIGIEYEESWLPRFIETNQEMEIIDSAEGIVRILETIPHSHDHDEDHADEADHRHEDDDDYGHNDDHDHELGLDPHVWLTPANGKIIARNIYAALVAASPDNEAVFTANYESLIEEIDALDNRISETLSGATQRKFMVYHPAWGYFANAYGLTQLTIQVGGTDPSPSELAALIDQALDEDIRVIFVQPQFSEANARAISDEIGGEVLQVNPLAFDWLSNLETVANAFAKALGN